MIVFAVININKKLCFWGERRVVNVDSGIHRSKNKHKTWKEYSNQLIQALDNEIQKINYNYASKDWPSNNYQTEVSIQEIKESDIDIPEFVRIDNPNLLHKGSFVLSFDTGLLSRWSGEEEKTLVKEALSVMGGWLLGRLYFDHGFKELVRLNKINTDMRERLKKCESQLLNNFNIRENDYSDLENSFLFGLIGFEIFNESDDRFIEGFCHDGYFSNVGINSEVTLQDELFGNLRLKEMINDWENGTGVIYISQSEKINYNQQDFEKDFSDMVNYVEQAMAHDDLNFGLKCYIFVNIDPVLKLPRIPTKQLLYYTGCNYFEVVELL